jgi:hypothetical protein
VAGKKRPARVDARPRDDMLAVRKDDRSKGAVSDEVNEAGVDTTQLRLVAPGRRLAELRDTSRDVLPRPRLQVIQGGRAEEVSDA